jgi:hypothetical protein
MVYTNRVRWETLRSLDTSTMASSSTWYNIGTKLLHPAYKLRIVNASNVLVTISIDGANAVDVVPASGGVVLYDSSQAQMSTSNLPAIPAGTQFSAQAASAGTGSLYLVVQYLITV